MTRAPTTASTQATSRAASWEATFSFQPRRSIVWSAGVMRTVSSVVASSAAGTPRKR